MVIARGFVFVLVFEFVYCALSAFVGLTFKAIDTFFFRNAESLIRL